MPSASGNKMLPANEGSFRKAFEIGARQSAARDKKIVIGSGKGSFSEIGV
jgi:hypothetical protein